MKHIFFKKLIFLYRNNRGERSLTFIFLRFLYRNNHFMKRSDIMICPYFRLKYYIISSKEEQLFCRCEKINKVILDEYYFSKFNSELLNIFKKKIFRNCLEHCPNI